MKIISVIPLKKGLQKGDLTYFTKDNMPPGNIVSVPVKNKTVLALVTSEDDLSSSKSDVKRMNFNLKKVIQDKGNSIFRKEFLETVFSTAKYSAQNKNNVFTALVPAVFINEYDKIARIVNEAKVERNTEQKKEKKIGAEKLMFQYRIEDRLSTYKTLIRESFAKGNSVYIVVPTQFDADNFSVQLSKGIEQFTYSLYGGLSAKKNLLAIEKIINTAHPVLIVGTAPYLSVPRRDINTIILENESSGAYKTLGKTHFDLRIFAEIYASKINAKFIMSGGMLRFETIVRKDTDNIYPLHPLSFRIDFNGEMEILEKGPGDKSPGKFVILKNESTEAIKYTLQNKKNVFIFSLRKGLATVTVCRDCGETMSCSICGTPLVLYLSHQGKKRIFVCNRCEREIDGDAACSLCGSWNLVPLGIGTDTVYEEVKNLFPGEKIFKLDRESAKTSAGAKKIIKEFEESPGAILVGTEMAFFYIKQKVALSVIASFDSLWSIPSFRMSEKIISIVISLADITSERIIIQTKNNKDSSITAIASGNLLPFVREELEDRKKLDYPPFKRFIKITHLGDKEQTAKCKLLLQETFKEYAPEIFSGFVARLKSKYVTNALIKIDPKKWSLPELSVNSSVDENLLAKLLSLQPNFEVAVDPEDLL